MKKVLVLGDVNSSHIQKWAGGVVSLGYDVSIFSLSSPWNDWYIMLGNQLAGNKTFSNDLFKGNTLFKIKYLLAFNSLRKVICHFKPDIIHAHYATSYGLIASMCRFHPVIISTWGSDVFDFPKKSMLTKLLLKYILKKSDGIVSPGIIMRNEIALYSKKIVDIIPFGIDVDRFYNNNSKNRDEFVVGIIKSLEPVYAISYLIEAFSLVIKKYKSRKLKLIITGDGSERENLFNLVSRLNLESYVTFTGKILQDEVPLMHNNFDIFACTSIQESFGVSVLEASACERPVVASNVGGLKEVVINNETGILVEIGNVNEIANAIGYFIDNPDMVKLYGMNGRKNVVANYNWKNNLTQVDNLYKRFLN